MLYFSFPVLWFFFFLFFLLVSLPRNFVWMLPSFSVTDFFFPRISNSKLSCNGEEGEKVGLLGFSVQEHPPLWLHWSVVSLINGTFCGSRIWLFPPPPFILFPLDSYLQLLLSFPSLPSLQGTTPLPALQGTFHALKISTFPRLSPKVTYSF